MKILKSALLISSVLLFTSNGIQAKNYKFATNIHNESAAGQLLDDFASSVSKKTDGRVKIRIFWNGTLGGQSQYLQQVQSGVIDLGLINSGTLENVVSEIGVLNLPYIFRSLEEYGQTMTNPDVKKEINKYVKNNNLYSLGFISNGFRSIYTTKQVNNINDLKGLKLRTGSSDTYINMIKLFGAVPTPLDFGEVYPALQQGIIDGAEGGLAGLWEVKFGEVAKYAVRTEHTRLTDFVLASEKFVSSINDNDNDMNIVQSEFDRISTKSLDFVDGQMAEAELIAIDKLGVKIIDIDKEPLIKMVEPMYKNAMQNENKKVFIQQIFKIQNREIN